MSTTETTITRCEDPTNRSPLSPAAQAVMDAVCDNTEPDCDTQHLIAAALRAAADQVVPEQRYPSRRGVRPGGTCALTPEEGAEDQRAATRRWFLSIAAELDGHHG
jgi:hypothetical protein